MSSIKKKAVSDIIAVVLLISLSIVTTLIISSSILPLVKQTVNLAPTVSCIELKTQPPITISQACFNKQSNEIKLQLERNTKELQLNEISFIFHYDNNVKSFKCNSECNNCEILNTGAEKSYFFSFPEFKETLEITYALDGCEIKTIKVNNLC